MSIRDNVFADILAERERQEALWGEQNHPDIFAYPESRRAYYESMARHWKAKNEHRVASMNAEGVPSDRNAAWDGILLEEVYEALAEADPSRLRVELIQVAAVAVNWLECLARRDEEACPYTHAHTRHWCGRPTCRES